VTGVAPEARLHDDVPGHAAAACARNCATDASGGV
jgi:hypothetical protein